MGDGDFFFKNMLLSTVVYEIQYTPIMALLIIWVIDPWVKLFPLKTYHVKCFIKFKLQYAWAIFYYNSLSLASFFHWLHGQWHHIIV
jgi:hypothetical protein